MNLREVYGFCTTERRSGNWFFPGFDGVPINQVITFVIKGFRKGVLVTRASSIAFNLLMALLPASIFLFTLIPFIPIPNFQQELIRLFENILPSNAFNFLETTIIDIVTHKSKGLLAHYVFCNSYLFNKWHTCSNSCICCISTYI